MEYSPLDPTENEIRLLEVDLSLVPLGNFSISCRMHTVSLRSSQPQYTALSYLWGDLVYDHTIDVDGRKVNVTRNLLEALDAVTAHCHETYTKHGKALYLWVDQICINQRDDSEKNHQVGYMRTIYSRAESVLIWLPVITGPEESDWLSGHRKDLKDHRHWSAWLRYYVQSRPEQRSPFFTMISPSKSLHSQNVGNMLKAWCDILSIVESPWWSRVWVFQEIILAERATFLIRWSSVPWSQLQEDISFFYRRIEQHKEDLDACVHHCKRCSDILRKSNHRERLEKAPWHFANFVLQQKMAETRTFPLSSLMLHGRICGSTDARDKVFAFLGLADPKYGIEINYAAANTAEDVSIEAAIAIMRCENGLGLLLGAIEYRGAYDPLPSWVPNLAATANKNSEYRKFLDSIGFPHTDSALSVKCSARAPTFEADRSGRPNRVLIVGGFRWCILTQVIEDRQDQPWRRFSTDIRGFEVVTRSTARVGDEVWLLDGLLVALTLTRPDLRDEYRTIVGHAMGWVDGQTCALTLSNAEENAAKLVSVSIV